MIITAKKRLVEGASDNSFIFVQTVKGDYGAFSAEEILEDLSNLNDGDRMNTIDGIVLGANCFIWNAGNRYWLVFVNKDNTFTQIRMTKDFVKNFTKWVK